MSIFDQLQTNVQKEADGVPIEFGANKDGSIPTFIIAAISRTNTKYTKEMERVTKPYRRNGGLIQSLGDERAESLVMDVFIKTVLKGWKNVQDRGGNEIEFTPANAKKIFTEVPRLYDILNNSANSVELFQDEAREEEAGN